MELPILFWRAASVPAGAFHLRRLLDTVRPRLVLVEGPSDLSGQLPDITRPETAPPIAILAYTQAAPVRSILYPFAEYSPEYQAIAWAHEHGAECRFMDLPSDVFLALGSACPPVDQREERGPLRRLCRPGRPGGGGRPRDLLGAYAGARHRPGRLPAGAANSAPSFAPLTAGREGDWAETVVRGPICAASLRTPCPADTPPGEIVAVTGAYHVEGLKTAAPMTDAEIAASPGSPPAIPSCPTPTTVSQPGQATARATGRPPITPCCGRVCRKGSGSWAAESYLARIALYQRESGTSVSSAEVIEAVRLPGPLPPCATGRPPPGSAGRGGDLPGRRQLRGRLLGGGQRRDRLRHRHAARRGKPHQHPGRFLPPAQGPEAGEIPGPHRPGSASDLRENRNVKSERSAFLDLERSFFLHRLRVLGVSFGQRREEGRTTPPGRSAGSSAGPRRRRSSWWSPLSRGTRWPRPPPSSSGSGWRRPAGMADIAAVIEDAFTCGMAGAVTCATAALQAMAVDAAGLDDLAATAQRLSVVVQYGGVRRLDSAPLEPILRQIYLRCCLILSAACACDDTGPRWRPWRWSA